MAAERGGVQLPELSWFKEEANGAERLLQRAVKGVLTPAELGGVGGGQPAQRTAEDNAQACARSRECAAELLGRFRGWEPPTVQPSPPAPLLPLIFMPRA